MQAIPYLNFKGNCKEAFEFYEQCLGGKIEAMIRFQDMYANAPCPEEWQNGIMHARLSLGDGTLMASDAPAERYVAPQGMWVSLHPQTPEEADRIFQALAEGGEIEMPIQATDWAARFGMVRDRFGISWMINCEKAA